MTTLLQLRDRAKQESDNVGQSFISDAEWTNYINAAYGDVYDLLASAYGSDYFVQTPATGYTFTTDGVNQNFALPADFYKLTNCSVRVSSPQQWVTLKQFPKMDMNTVSLFNTTVPAAGQTVRLFYVPRVTMLSADGDSIADPVSINRWDELIVAKACIKALAKEETDVSVFLATEARMTKRLEEVAEDRDASQPARIIDVFGKRARSMQYRIMGANIMLVGGATPGWYYGGGDWGPGGDYDGEAWGGF